MEQSLDQARRIRVRVSAREAASGHGTDFRSPDSLPAYVPELDGLRGLAVLMVVIYHCHDKLGGVHLESLAHWGWAGVNLFFVLSGFLITGIIVDSRRDPHFFRNFYARRGLRIWPVYLLLLLLNYVIVPWVFGNFWWAFELCRNAPWPYYLLFVQNLFLIAIPGTIGPTWSLAIEEQFYVVWAPVARYFRAGVLLPLLIAILIASPFFRMAGGVHITPTNTLNHLDGLAVGALIALGMRKLGYAHKVWKWITGTSLAIGLFGTVYMVFRGSAFTDSYLAIGFGGILLAALRVTGSASRYGAALKVRPLRFLGTISYGLYMTHILVFTLIGAFDQRMLRYGAFGGLTVVIVRLALSISVASLMWYGFEKPILRLKSYFVVKPIAPQLARIELPDPELVAAD